MRSSRLIVAAAFVVLACGIGGRYALTKFVPASDSATSWPPPYNSLHPGAAESEVIGKFGNPIGQSDNPLYQQKTPAEWDSIQRQVDTLARRSSDPYNGLSAPDHARYVELSRLLEHRVKSIWTYPAASPSTDEVALSFDGNGKLMRVDVKKAVHSRSVAFQRSGQSDRH